jgi:hypothetical protein
MYCGVHLLPIAAAAAAAAAALYLPHLLRPAYKHKATESNLLKRQQALLRLIPQLGVPQVSAGLTAAGALLLLLLLPIAPTQEEGNGDEVKANLSFVVNAAGSLPLLLLLLQLLLLLLLLLC